MKKILDISKHNGNIDWKKVKADNISGVILRAGYGKSTIDEKFIQNIKGCISVGLPIGIYWFSYAYTVGQAENEANFCLKTINTYKKYITLPVAFDWEYDSMSYAKRHGVNPTRKLITDMNVAFCEIIKKAGYTPMVYYNKDYMNNYLNMNKLSNYVHWMAYYSSNKPSNCDIWQYSESGGISGINSNGVDKNYLINEKLLIKENKLDDTSKKINLATINPIEGENDKDRFIRTFKARINTDLHTKFTNNSDYTIEFKNIIKTHNLSKNCKYKNMIIHLQWWLKHEGYKGLNNKELAVDGDFGNNTEYAVKNLQKKLKISQDGIFGNNTMDKWIKTL